MPEGDTIFIAATQLRKALLGRLVTGFESTVPAVLAMVACAPLTGRLITAVKPRGKHLLMTFSPPPIPGGAAAEGDLILHTHMRMTGSWHIYRPGEAFRKPRGRAVVVLHTAAFVCPCFSAPIVELLTSQQVRRHPDLIQLGPDAITDDFDQAEALRRLRLHGDQPIGVVLLNQRALCGVGNVYKSEALFCQRLWPFTAVGDLTDPVLSGLVAECHQLLQKNREHSRRTLFSLDPRARYWVYGRSGEPCRICGQAIVMKRQGLDGRSTYFCPHCQPPRAP